MSNLIWNFQIEELQAEEKKLLEQFKKDQESAIKKAKVADNTLKQVQIELENFQVIKYIIKNLNNHFLIYDNRKKSRKK
jgi:hypothetical protein